MRNFPRLGTCLLALALVGTVWAREPLNLSTAKADVVRYVDSGEYQQDLGAVTARAEAWMRERLARLQPGEKPALVLDVDETALSNYEHMKSLDFGDVPGQWDPWVESAKAPAIGPVLGLFKFARQHGVAVFFLTGRRESQEAATARNLRAAGYDGYAALICQPDVSHEPDRAFKLAARRRLAAEGWTIIANVGDQESDLAGGAAERGFKLPDPFYLIP